jgi:hypothetical protein
MRWVWGRTSSRLPHRNVPERSQSFWSAWIASRDRRDLVLGIPAALALLLSALTLGPTMGQQEETAERYMEVSEAERLRGREELAAIYRGKAERIAQGGE